MSSSSSRRSPWQSETGRCATALRLVLAWLRGAELARAGAACRAWRRAAAEPALWRALLRRRGPAAAAALAPRPAAALRDCLAYADNARICWRDEYVSACAGWHLEESLRPSAGDGGGGVALVHAALCDSSRRLALLADDASLSVWEPARETSGWTERWGSRLAARGWSAAVRAEWAADGARLLLAGSLALTDRWELLVLHFDDECRGTVVSRAGCSAGAAGCWSGAEGVAYLSLELRLLAPRLACTTVWLNSATQETESEYTGVTAPLLRIFNEEAEHLTHVLVAEVALEAAWAGPAAEEDEDVDRAYYRVTLPKRRSDTLQTAVCAWGAAGGGGALGTWALGALRPPPLCALERGDLRARAARPRPARPARGEPAPAPDDAAVRALCTPPDHECWLPAPVVGLVAHQSGRCAWASTSDGRAVCLSLPALRLLRELTPSGADVPSARAPLHYVQPAVSDEYVVRPVGAWSERVLVWRALSGARCRPPRGDASAPVPVALLPRVSPPALLVLAGDAVHVWRSRATPQEQMLY